MNNSIHPLMWNKIKPRPIILHAQYFASLKFNTRWKLKDIKVMSAVKPLLSSVWAMRQSSPPPHASGTGQSGRIWSPSFSLSIRLESPDQSPICTDQINAPKEKKEKTKVCLKLAQTLKSFDICNQRKKASKSF